MQTYLFPMLQRPHLPSAQTIAIFSYIDPVIAILISVTILHEPFTVYSALGSVLILGAAFVSEKG